MEFSLLNKTFTVRSHSNQTFVNYYPVPIEECQRLSSAGRENIREMFEIRRLAEDKFRVTHLVHSSKEPRMRGKTLPTAAKAQEYIVGYLNK